jgi:hypothetical protein
LGVAIAVLLLAGAAAAASESGDDSDVAAGDTTSTTLAGGTSSVPAVVVTLPDGTPATDPATGAQVTEAPATTAPTGTSAAPTTAPPSDDAIPVPVIPQSGTYAYHVSITTTDGTEESDAETLYERLSGDDRTGTARVRQPTGEGTTTTNDITIAADKVTINRSVIESPQGTFECNWNPPWTYLGPFQAGATFTIESVCNTSAASPIGQVNITVTLEGTGIVKGTTRVDVNGTETAVWIVERTIDTTIAAGPQNFSSHAEETVLIDPVLGMPVQSDTHTTANGEQYRVQTSYTGFTPQ